MESASAVSDRPAGEGQQLKRQTDPWMAVARARAPKVTAARDFVRWSGELAWTGDLAGAVQALDGVRGTRVRAHPAAQTKHDVGPLAGRAGAVGDGADRTRRLARRAHILMRGLGPRPLRPSGPAR